MIKQLLKNCLQFHLIVFPGNFCKNGRHRRHIIFGCAAVDEHNLDEFEKTGLINKFGRENVFKATERAGQSTLDALKEAEKWMKEKSLEQPGSIEEDEGSKGDNDVLEGQKKT